ncbi:hypothetical protein AX14_010195 [Amanita brunnescens Koide BX004]|nr:hypothetical protein AX14_010195 [Amanita brunnescens Koide BX004]
MSSDEQSNTTDPGVQEHTHSSPAVTFAPQLLNGATQLGAYPPHFFAYASPSDGNHSENGPNSVPTAAPPYMIPFPPPGMVYAFPPPQGQVPPGVKMACTNCAAACKRCDEDRPCARCQRYGISDSCRDGQRKQRKKGVKRGSYKRRNKNGEVETEWTPSPQAPIAPYTSPEGYYGIYFPNTGAFLPHPPHEVPGQEGAVPANGAPPIVPYFLPAFPPYPPPYGHPAMYPGLIPPAPPPQQPPQSVQPQVVEPQQTIQQISNSPVKSSTTSERQASGKEKDEGSSMNGATGKAVASGSGTHTTATSKKRNRSSKGGESKARRVKKSRAAVDKEDKDNGGAQAVAS